MKGRLPNFFIIGGMKCGTTSLHDYLDKHPDIFMSNNKEIHYFSDEFFNKHDLNWYKNQFITSKKLAGTSPQNYTKCHNKYYQGIPKRLKKYVPNARFIYILRDPIQRYQSHIIENYYGEPPHDVAYNIKSQHYEKTGLYYMQLKEYLKYFDLNQFHILTLEDLKENRLDTMNKIFVFLGVKEIKDKQLFDFVSNAHETKTIPYFLLHSIWFRALRKLFPYLANKIGTSKTLKKYIFKKGQKIHLNEEKITYLKTFYEEDVKELRKLTGLSFSSWSI